MSTDSCCVTSVNGEDGVGNEFSLNALCNLPTGEGGGEGITRRCAGESVSFASMLGVFNSDIPGDTGDGGDFSCLTAAVVDMGFFGLLLEVGETLRTSPLAKAAWNTRSASPLVVKPWYTGYWTSRTFHEASIHESYTPGSVPTVTTYAFPML